MPLRGARASSHCGAAVSWARGLVGGGWGGSGVKWEGRSGEVPVRELETPLGSLLRGLSRIGEGANCRSVQPAKFAALL